MVEIPEKEFQKLQSRLKELEAQAAERKRAEEEIGEAEQRFRVIFDNATDGILLADLENKKFSIGNKMICQMLGYGPEEIKNLGVMDIHPKQDLPYVIDQFEKQSRKEITLAKDIPVLRKDGSVFYADVNSAPVTLAGKTYLLGIFRDITERKRLEQEVEKLLQETWNANKELKKIDTLKDEFLSIVTHDLKTPLISLLGYAGILLDGLAGELNQKQKEHLSTIKRQGQALDGLIDTILDYTRVEFGKLTANPEEFILDKMIIEIIGDIKPQADQKRIVLTVNLPPGEIMLKCDQGMIRRVMANLVGNAIKYTQEEGKVMVNVSREGSKVRIVVQDNGRGIAPENLPKLFDKFFVVSAKEARAKRSLGLGLYIAKTFAELNGGKLGVESEGEGKGSRFILELPC